ncbi:hypothetical protein B7P43_G02720 [Cryptotermes secundus]|uniref:Mos1 transposase HTH domain-containing protein n=1 Tax=Cryptotermes secundus TaxID=105785 RepID=A0A2J7RQG1_9NEOP|nr:hypothetical protein B7P43_G02720 [Cryptotermes secundus]
MRQFEQHANIKFMCKWEKSASEMQSALQQIYGDSALKKSAVYDWFSRFKNWQETLEDDQRSGRPSTSRTEEMIGKVRQLIRCDRRMTIAELEQEVGVSHGSIHAILFDDLRMRRVSANDKWQGQWFLHHDNEPSHTALVVQQFLAEKNISVITQPPYSPDLAPSDFWLFPALKMGLRGTHFATMEDTKSNATAELRKIPKEAFHRCFQQWQDRWSMCLRAQGSYFESDYVSVAVCPTIRVLYHYSGDVSTAPRIYPKRKR